MILELDSLTHRYADEPAVEDVSFGLERGELASLLGPSGCGKTTIVQAIAGHATPTSGRIVLRGEAVTDTPPESRRVGIVFQKSTLYPHMTVGENIAYGLTPRDIDPDRRDELVAEYLELVELREQYDAYPSELSGGQKRRVELARTLAPRPDILLLDEPLSALDRTLRVRLREEIERIQRETGVTTLFVTHNQDDAMALADRIIVMNDGRVSGIGRPRTLYESPPTPFVAAFLGRSNALSASVVRSEPLTIKLGQREITVNNTNSDLPKGSDVTCHIRPQDVSCGSSDANGAGPSVTGEVTRVADRGRRYDVAVRVETGDELLVEYSASPPTIGDTLPVELPVQRMTIFSDEDDRRISVGDSK